MRKNTRRVLALVMALVLILGNFTGLGTTAKAAENSIIWNASTSVKTVPSQGGKVAATISGENLDAEVYYKISATPEGGFPSMIVRSATVSCPAPTGGEIQIPVPANEEEVKRNLKIWVCGTSDFSDQKQLSLITQEAAGGQTPSVDKTELEKAIKAAEACQESDYTTDAWGTLLAALANARKVNKDSNATGEEVKAATKALNDAIAAGKPAVEDTAIKAKVVDEKGNPVSGVVFQVIEYSGTKEEIDQVTSDGKGLVEYSTKNLQANGEYQLKAPMKDPYFFQPNEGYLYTLNEEKKVKKVTHIDGTTYEKEEVVFTAKKMGGTTDPEEPEADARTLKVRVVDEEGLPIVDPACKFAVINTEFANVESEMKSPKNGVFTVEFDNVQPGAIIRLASKTKDYEVISDPKQLDVTLDKGVIKAVNGETYDGNQEFKFVVKYTGRDADKATIKGAVLTKQQLTADGGEVGLYVTGTKLNGNLNVEVKSGGRPTDITPIPDLNLTDVMHSYTIKFPANETTEDKYYNVCCSLGDGAEGYKDLLVIVAGKTESGGEGEVDPEGKVTITQLTSDVKDRIPKLGATVNLFVEGENLGRSNWGAKAVAYMNMGNGDLHEIPNKTVKATNVTSTGAQLEIPRGITSVTEWHVIAGPLDEEGQIEEQQKLILTQEAASATEQVFIKTAVLLDAHTVEIEFEKEVQIAPIELSKELYDEKGKLKEEELKKLFYFTSGVAGIDRYDIKEDDTIEVNGSKLTITFADGVSFNNAFIHFLEGGLATTTTEGVKLLTAFSWNIDSKPMVHDVVFDQSTFDYKGGKVVARVKGSRLDELSVKPSGSKEADLTATVRNAAEKEEADLGMEITGGKEPVITFNVPENETDRTQSYILDMKIQGRPVYGGTGLRGHRFVVSVLPKDTDASAQTLSSLTITAGNNKEENADPSYVIVEAQPGVEGALKTELRLTGTNLDATKTEVRAIDENGVIWPISHVPE